MKFGLLNVMRIGQTHLGTVLVGKKKKIKKICHWKPLRNTYISPLDIEKLFIWGVCGSSDEV